MTIDIANGSRYNTLLGEWGRKSTSSGEGNIRAGDALGAGSIRTLKKEEVCVLSFVALWRLG